MHGRSELRAGRGTGARWGAHRGVEGRDVPHRAVSAEKEPQNPSFQYHLGMAYFATGDRPRAKEALEKALRLKPDFVEAGDARKILAQM